MKKVVYLKVSNKCRQVKASYDNNFEPLHKQYSYNAKDKYYPTITIKLNLDIPDNFFDKAQKELDIKINELNLNTEIKVEELKKELGVTK